MTLLSPRPGIGQIRPYRPSAPPDDGRAWIDLSLTVNPLGPSARALAAYRRAAAHIHRYPDAAHATLRSALARTYEIDSARIACGGGSEELIHLLTLAFAGPGDEVLCHAYGYQGFGKAIRVAGATPVIAAERDLVVDVDAMIERAGPRTRVCLLANPNNPTGTYVATEAVRRLRGGLPAHTLLVLDSAYADFVRRDNYSDGRELVEDSDNVVVVRTFSKMYGLAGLRVGWAYGALGVIDALNQVRGGFNVSVPAQAAAAAALADHAHVAATHAHNAVWLAWLSEALRAIGLHVYPSVCNFLLVRLPVDPSLGVAEVTAHLARRHILVRPVGDYGLNDGLRITIGQEEENRALVAALGEILN